MPGSFRQVLTKTAARHAEVNAFFTPADDKRLDERGRVATRSASLVGRSDAVVQRGIAGPRLTDPAGPGEARPILSAFLQLRGTPTPGLALLTAVRSASIITVH